MPVGGDKCNDWMLRPVTNLPMWQFYDSADML